MRLRIIELNGKFYPQYYEWGIWRKFKENNVDVAYLSLYGARSYLSDKSFSETEAKIHNYP